MKFISLNREQIYKHKNIMKKIASILILVFAFTITTQAQKRNGKASAEKMLTKLTKDLDLTVEQQNKIKPLLEAQIADAEAMMEKRKELKDADQKPSKEERQKMRKERDAKETAMNNNMQNILSKEQFEKFKEIAQKRKDRAKEKKKMQ